MEERAKCFPERAAGATARGEGGRRLPLLKFTPAAAAPALQLAHLQREPNHGEAKHEESAAKQQDKHPVLATEQGDGRFTGLRRVKARGSPGQPGARANAIGSCGVQAERAGPHRRGKRMRLRTATPSAHRGKRYTFQFQGS